MLDAIAALTDNYIWCWQLTDKTWVVVDPGAADPVLARIPKKEKISPIGTLLRFILIKNT